MGIPWQTIEMSLLEFHHSNMNSIRCCLILLILPLMFAYPRRYSNDLERLLNLHFRERAGNVDDDDNNDDMNSNEDTIERRQLMYPIQLQHQLQQQVPQAMCLPNIWTCGPDLPPCCPGLMCYDGNAKRGRHCIARG